MEGIFTISLDFELHWGVFDKKDRDTRKQCYENTLLVIPRMLELFAKYDVRITWATVGSLFAKDETEWNQWRPAILPAYNNPVYSVYEWSKRHPLTEDFAWAHFAPDTIRKIQQYPGQEMGTHTFAHFYCQEIQEHSTAFEKDLEAANLAAKKFDTQLISLVFPRNQFNEAVLEICYYKGIRAVRSNPSDWFWSPVAEGNTNFLRKIFRTGDAFLRLGKKTSYPLRELQMETGKPLQLPASRFLRPWSPGSSIANKLRLRRILGEIKQAALRNECYHLWWHPENFGDYPEENLKDLESILLAYNKCKELHGMKSWNMGDFVNHFNQPAFSDVI